MSNSIRTKTIRCTATSLDLKHVLDNSNGQSRIGFASSGILKPGKDKNIAILITPTTK